MYRNLSTENRKILTTIHADTTMSNNEKIEILRRIISDEEKKGDDMDVTLYDSCQTLLSELYGIDEKDERVSHANGKRLLVQRFKRVRWLHKKYWIYKKNPIFLAAVIVIALLLMFFSLRWFL